MKPVISLLLCCLFAFTAKVSNAQPYGNEWIDYSKTYYKFKVGAEGVYKISRNALLAAGVPSSATGASFKMFRDGVEIPLLVSTAGVFTANDYIVFYGRKADGQPDTQLFETAGGQADVGKSLFTDTAAYFLTVDATNNNVRFVNVANTINNPPAAQSFCYSTSAMHYLHQFFKGRNYSGLNIWYSIFESGDGFGHAATPINTPINISLNTPHFVPGQTCFLNAALIRNSYSDGQGNVTTTINNQQINSKLLPTDATTHISESFNSNILNTTTNIVFNPTATNTTTDVVGCSYISIKYPRDFDVSGLDFFKFELNASSSFQYLVFQNFNHNNTAPKLYDLTNHKWYAGDISIAGETRYYIEPSFTERTLILVSENAAAIKNILAAQTLQFTDYTNGLNQGDYIIITHENYRTITNGRNYINDYEAYRESITGGGYKVITADVDDLYDQFAFGLDMHPAGIRNFLKYAYDTWPSKPQHVFLIGRGIYHKENRAYAANKDDYNFVGNVPPSGYPGSDVNYVNFLPDKMQAISIGRLSAWTPQEIGNYLEKLKNYEALLKSPLQPNHHTEEWKKLVFLAAGGQYAGESELFLQTLINNSLILKDTAFGARTKMVSKSSTDPIDQNANAAIDSIMDNGVSLLQYHGHASASSVELSAFNTPENFTNGSKLPHFLGLGCDIAQIFSESSMKTISERYVSSTTGGAISVIAGDNLQFPNFHQLYLPRFNNSVSKINYGQSIGQHIKFVYNNLRSTDKSILTFFQLESTILQGDPALRVFSPEKPDYHVASNQLSATPANVTTATDSFSLKITVYNLAKAIRDTVDLKITHINPAGIQKEIALLSLANLFNTDTVTINIPVDELADIGLNKYKVMIDPADTFQEMSESNNEATLELFIYSDNVIPIYPKEFDIIHQQNITLKASTLNAFRPMGRYRIEIDTTELFNSNQKQTTVISSPGGVIKWTPTIAYQDSVVYYWRASFDSAVNGDFQWANSSFIYLANGSPGWNQSHYYQYQKDDRGQLLAYGPDRVFKYPTGNTMIEAKNAVYSQFATTTPWDNSVYAEVVVNGATVQYLGCQPWDGTIQFMVFDATTTRIWQNNHKKAGGSGSYSNCLKGVSEYAFEFGVYSLDERNKAMHFLDSIPDKNYVLVKNMINDLAYDTALVNEWKADELVNGAGKSLYHSLYNMGFTLIDSFTTPRPFLFFAKKNDHSFPITQVVYDYADTIIRNFSLPRYIDNGDMTSTIIGPASQWQDLKWRVSAIDNQIQHDINSVTAYGVDDNNQKTFLFTTQSKDTSLANISAKQYPFLELRWDTKDTVNQTSAQLDYWRVLYEPLPEAALNPAAHLQFSDSLYAGQPMLFSVAIENLTLLPMDSMLVRYKVIDAHNTVHTIATKRYKPLAGEDSLHALIEFDPYTYPGNNVFFVEANPDNDQPEQYHPNNLGYIPFEVTSDRKNPLIDVTFDGVHILDGDIVSAKPFIKIVLKDENQFMKLDDTSLFDLYIRYPSDNPLTRRKVPFDGNTCKFLPAASHSKKNEAFIEYAPNFIEDGTYELIVDGKDKSGNTAGLQPYRISFEVINKATITHVLNYPNPFSTSTAFLFTLTGSQIPTQFKIQIMTVTGKVVKEITKQELGPIHIGRNITEYKWDGRDRFGQLLGNGVYFYRVVTSLNGKSIEHNSNQTDKFFKKGYGKMYIMR